MSSGRDQTAESGGAAAGGPRPRIAAPVGAVRPSPAAIRSARLRSCIGNCHGRRDRAVAATVMGAASDEGRRAMRVKATPPNSARPLPLPRVTTRVARARWRRGARRIGRRRRRDRHEIGGELEEPSMHVALHGGMQREAPRRDADAVPCAATEVGPVGVIASPRPRIGADIPDPAPPRHNVCLGGPAE